MPGTAPALATPAARAQGDAKCQKSGRLIVIRITATMMTRLSRVRGQMTDAEFSQLLRDMVRTAERFAEIDSRSDLTAVAAAPEAARPTHVQRGSTE